MLNNFLLIVFAVLSELSTKFQRLLFHWWWDWTFFSPDFIKASLNLHSCFSTCHLLMNFESFCLIYCSLPLFLELYLRLKFSKFFLFFNFPGFDTPWLFWIRRRVRIFWTARWSTFTWLFAPSCRHCRLSPCLLQPIANFALEFKHPVINIFEP